jgi:hypothetical protein
MSDKKIQDWNPQWKNLEAQPLKLGLEGVGASVHE